MNVKSHKELAKLFLESKISYTRNSSVINLHGDILYVSQNKVIARLRTAEISLFLHRKNDLSLRNRLSEILNELGIGKLHGTGNGENCRVILRKKKGGVCVVDKLNLFLIKEDGIQVNIYPCSINEVPVY